MSFSGVLLLSDRTVPVDTLTFKKTVTHHALTKQKKDDRQDNCQHELNSERGWLSSGRVRVFCGLRIDYSNHLGQSNAILDSINKLLKPDARRP